MLNFGPQAKGVSTVAVGVGNSLKVSVLEKIAGSDGTVLKSLDFEDLRNTVKDIVSAHPDHETDNDDNHGGDDYDYDDEDD